MKWHKAVVAGFGLTLATIMATNMAAAPAYASPSAGAKQAMAEFDQEAAAAEAAPIHCDPLTKVCWWLDPQGQLQGTRGDSVLAVAFAQRRSGFSMADAVPPQLDAKMRARYDAIRAKLSRGWSVAANSIVSDAAHADMQTMAMAAHQVTSAWTEAVVQQLTKDTNAHNDQVYLALAPVAAVLSFNTVMFSPYLQNLMFQVLLRYAIPSFLESNNYVWTDIPNAISQAIQNAEVGKLREEIAKQTDILLSHLAFNYAMADDGEKQLDTDTPDQSAQVRKLQALAGLPMQLSKAAEALRKNHDFRLAYAAKIAPIVGQLYSEHLNCFIVTEHFGELAWAKTGVAATGVIFDLYLREGDPAYDTSRFGGLPVDNRRKRTWSIDTRGRLEPKDAGPYMEGRMFDTSAALILPYWDEPVKPWKGEAPILRGHAMEGLPSL